MENNWISVKERLPEKPGKRNYEHVYCLTSTRRGIKLLAWNCEHHCWDDEDGDDISSLNDSVTHWQPLPEPPKEV